jgi:1,4-alpha-glucan branching enzyme
MSIKKQFLKSKPVCKVTFRVSKDDVANASEVKVLGSFNNWDRTAEPMGLLKSGEFTQTIELTSGSEYEFRYLIDNAYWLNDAEADGSIPNSFGELNSVINTVE